MAEPAADTDLFALGQRFFRDFSGELAAYGLPVDAKMEIRRGKGLLCFYDTADGHVYLSVPDLSTAMGRLNVMVLRAYLSAKSDDEVLRFFRLFIPRLIAHEMGHHLRHRAGLFGENYWEEEQIANQLAVAVTLHRLTPDERAFAKDFLKRAIEGLSQKVKSADAATVSYYNVLAALSASGRIGESGMEQAEAAQKLFAIDPRRIAEATPELERRRDDVIAQINSEYASDYVQYMYLHAGWLYVDLTSHVAEYVDEFARNHLGVAADLLPSIPASPAPSDDEVHACFRAASELTASRHAASRYFYKRYRMLLWTRLESAQLATKSQNALLRREAQFFVENWSEGESDAMTYLAQIAPPDLRALFPGRIAERPAPEGDLAALLPSETDRRLYLHAARGAVDPAAEATLYRLTLLDETDVFRPVPAESLLEIGKSLCRIRLDAGETIIWEGEVNDDVFFLTRGALSILVTENGRERRVGVVRPGEVFGEMAFFSRDTRNATARALEPSECFVIKDSDLLLLVFKHPSILMQMAGALTRRLAGLNKRAASGELGPMSMR